MSETITIIIIFAIVSIILFFILRELMCWYWKINDIVKILLRIEAKLSTSINEAKFSAPINYDSTIAKKETVDEAEESDPMKKYGITFENKQYVYKGYKYDKLENAINYAKLVDQPNP